MICTAVKTCELCKRHPAIKGLRFCLTCRNRMMIKMAKSGYLQKVPRERVSFRDQDARESTSRLLPPSWDNVLQALDNAGEPMDTA